MDRLKTNTKLRIMDFHETQNYGFSQYKHESQNSGLSQN